jgi:TRAP-type transport system periplasmic protein
MEKHTSGETKKRGWTLWALVIAAATAVGAPTVAQAETVSLGTVAPKNSIWGKVFGVWQEAVKKKSDGKLELNVFYNAIQGDDGAMIDKLKSGQLDGAAVSSIGLAKIHKPILALQLPGVFRSWKALDAARDAVGPELQKGAEEAGFYVTFGDLGKLRGMSIGFAARTPSSLGGKRVLTTRSDRSSGSRSPKSASSR